MDSESEKQFEESGNTEERLKKIERRLGFVVTLCIIQCILLTLIFLGMLANQLMPSTTTFVILVMTTVVLVYLFRHQIPTWLGSFSRYVFAHLLSVKETDSMKDVN